MRMLVAGGCGFLGSHVCEHFKKEGWQVVAYDNMTKFETSRITFGDQDKIRNYNYDFLKSIGVTVVIADIRDMVTLNREVQGCDCIINCAAQPTMTLSEDDPIFDFDTNVVGSINLLECGRKYKIPVALCSSIHVYGTGINDNLKELHDSYMHPSVLIDENHPVLTGELTPLHASKRCSEIYSRMYAETYGLKSATFRLTGIYGERQFGSEEHGWVSLLAIKTMLGLPIQLIGNGKQVRDILYVTDAVNAFDMWVEAGYPAGVYNIGGGRMSMISVLQCIKRISRIFGKEQVIIPGGSRRGDLLYFACDTSKAYTSFGWQPTIETEEGLNKLVGWLQECKTVFNV